MMEMVVNFRSHILTWPCYMYWTGLLKDSAIECFQSRGKQSYWVTLAKDNDCIKIEFSSRMIGSGHQYGRRCVFGCREVT